MKDNLSFQVMKALEKSPKQSQRALSQRCGVSLGSVSLPKCFNTKVT